MRCDWCTVICGSVCVKGWMYGVSGGCGASADNAAPGSSVLALTLNLCILHSHGFKVRVGLMHV